MKSIARVIVTLLVLLLSPTLLQACPYLASEESTGIDQAHHVRVSSNGKIERRHRKLAPTTRASLRSRLRKFLNRFDFLGIFLNPTTPKAPTKAPVAPTKAPVAVRAPTKAPVAPTPVNPPPSPVAVPSGTAPTVVAVPAPTPITTPVSSPVANPVLSAPRTTPTPAPIAAAPISAPVAIPVAIPVTTPVAAPVATPAAAPVAAPTLAGMNTTQLVAAARAEIVAVIQANPDVSMAAKFVRLAFHDCVGGCDGCVDMANLDNTGLNTPINALDSVVTKYTVAGTNLTRADIWALAGLTGAGNAQNTTSIDFALTYIGRPVCTNLANGAPATRAGPDRTLPSAHLSTTQVLAFFASNFGFTETETVAIMGAHTLGRAVPQNSGFAGQAGWGPDQNILDNNFYTTLLTRNGRIQAGFAQELQNNAATANTQQFSNQFLWRINNRAFMLNADMALALDMNGYLNGTSGAVSCSLFANGTIPATDGSPVATTGPTCPDAQTLATAANYARDNAAWVTDFRNAFTKMVNTGCNATVCTAI